ncbi:MAG: DUF3276 family protein [Armatimonadota bacterium]|nr:DUF3276 family protein [Armatimonadota bacterium]MDR7443418.1 DUF3276 family protein [Armatimonadota bacterium]MDR7568455.1 DUF3276 family protein [Armatimonadota bacterium]MDR7602395.1 DUF3276 family protein [Armatimonadota bacterium]
MVGNGRKALFSERVRARGRVYFFDVREATGGSRYLVISESRRTHDGHERSRLVVFPDALNEFGEVLRRATDVLTASSGTGYPQKPVRKP